MRIRSRLLMRAGGLGLACLTRAWMGTLDYRLACYDRSVDPADPSFRGPAVFLFWHEYIPFLFNLRGHCNIAMLLSQHRDAEWLAEATRHQGFGTVRGSTRRGGAAALRRMMTAAGEMNLTITPDGPLGPRRRMSQGPIYLSSRLQIPLVLVGLGYDRPWRLNTWDRFAVPRPFSRACAIGGPHIQIPPDIDREGVEYYRLRVENLLNRLTEEAEAWAADGRPREGQIPLRYGPAPLKHFRCGEEGVEAKPADILPMRKTAG